MSRGNISLLRVLKQEHDQIKPSINKHMKMCEWLGEADFCGRRIDGLDDCLESIAHVML